VTNSRFLQKSDPIIHCGGQRGPLKIHRNAINIIPCNQDDVRATIANNVQDWPGANPNGKGQPSEDLSSR
jgi:hypothetical protein